MFFLCLRVEVIGVVGFIYLIDLNVVILDVVLVFLMVFCVVLVFFVVGID